MTVEQIVLRIIARKSELLRLTTEADFPDDAKAWVGAKVAELNDLLRFIDASDADGGEGGET